jgi:signal transduction histidine kinase
MSKRREPAEAATQDDLQRLKRELEGVRATLAQVQQRKSILLAMAVHDLRTPLAIIQGYSQLLAADLSPDANADIREYVANIVAHADSLATMIENLVMFDQVERDELRISCDRCDLGELVDQVIAQVEGLTSVKNLTIRRRSAPDSIRVRADEKRISRVLYNVFSHATKYAQPNSELVVAVGGGDNLGWMSVRDPHLFVNDDTLARLFDLVEDGAESGAALRGMDIGLVVARHIVEAHGGRIEATCKPDLGTTFQVYLPSANIL